jgi:phosphohistidine phosphatase
MRSLILFRHAKSDWNADYGGDDQMRPLSHRGRAASRTMGRFLANARQLPDTAMASPAVRAERTLALAMRAGGWDCPVRVKSELYEDASAFLRVVRIEPISTRTLLMVGHEPTLSEVTRLLTGGVEVQIPTAAMVRLDLEIEHWCDLSGVKARISWLVTPRLLR